MTDNLTTQDADLSTVPSGTTFALDNIAGVYYQRVKVTWGADGVANDAASGSGLPVAQDGSWSVNAVQSGAWNVTNITGTIPLPTGAATAAKQPALGTAGAASADVITVQGITSMTPLKVDGSGFTQPVSYATTGHGTATGAIRVELPTDGTGVIATVSTVSTVTTVAAVTAITNALPAGTNTIGKTFAAPQTTKALTQASISINASGDNTVVAGTASQTIRVFRLVLVAASAVNVTIKNNTAGAALTGAIPLSANGSLVVDVADGGEPAFVSASGGNLVVNLGGAVTVTGWIDYTKS